MKAVIVDDEYYALEGLRMELEDIGGIQVVGMYSDGSKLLEEISALNPDILFLDIEMPEMNGFELLEKVLQTGVRPQVVFVTAYNQYAVQAFETNAVDYLVKPVVRNRLVKTLDKISRTNPIPKAAGLEINCFRYFSVLSDGKEINTGWRTRKAEELIAYLLCEKGRFASKEKIAETLWPELDGEKSVSNLYLAYYYIKKQETESGVRIPIESERGKMRIRIEEMQCDIVTFDGFYDAVWGKDPPNRKELMEKAVKLYRGALLENVYYSWAVDFQQQYERQYVNLLTELMSICEETHDISGITYYSEKLAKLRG